MAALPVATAARRAPLPPPDAAGPRRGGGGDRARGTPAPRVRACSAPLTTPSGCARSRRRCRPPVLVTPKAKGALADPHPLALGLLAADSALLRRADLVVAIGVDTVEVAPGVLPVETLSCTLVRSASSGSLQSVAEAVGDIALVIEDSRQRLLARDRADWDVAELDRMKRAAGVVPAALASLLAPHRVVMIARELTAGGDHRDHGPARRSYWQAVAPREF